MSELALFGGKPAVTYVGTGKNDGTDMFKWPIITKEDEDAVLEVLRRGGMSGTDVTKEFEKEYCAWSGSKYALGTCNGTAALLAAMYGAGVGRGDEVICPSITYWASCTSALTLGATVVFADIDPMTLCLDPKKLESKITNKTKAIMVVHYLSYPADMDEIMAIAKKHNVKVIEDVSHAQGGLYKGRKLGTIGDVSASSLMSGKSFAVGEAGILQTDDIEIYERAIAFASYERFGEDIQTDYLKPLAGLPLGGHKHRMHQLSSACGRVQLKYYDERCAEIRKAMNYFWDQLEGVPGIRAHRVDESTGSNMAGWYAAHGIYVPEELGGLSITRFCEALRAEGANIHPGCNLALHTHALYNVADIYNDGKPTRIAFADKDVREMDKDLEVSEGVGKRVYNIPWFKKFDTEVIDQYVNAFKKVCANYKELLADDPGDPEKLGGWHFFNHSAKKAN
ncbi:MAG: DegT/DnrJ/EryC1/StrS family aminotransferase [Oscillospiraceae bacterium]|nr:DegT/DnrJ/EryC1/StrS family aminotransferase [Oscillospiraceae bacterium]